MFVGAQQDRKVRIFSLKPEFVAQYKDKQPPWGPLGYFVYKRTYSRPLFANNPDGPTEEWYQTCQRVVEGVYNIQKHHCRGMGLEWKEEKAQISAKEMYDRMFNFKFLPPGRGLWSMGTDAVMIKGGAILNNCFAGETEILTADGVKKIRDVAGTIQTLLVHDGTWAEAPVRSFGIQKLVKLTVERGGAYKTVFCTANHRWLVSVDPTYPICNISHYGSPVVLNGIEAREVETTLLAEGVPLYSVLPGVGVGPDVEPWFVVSVKETGREEEVFCATVPQYGNFTLADGLLTGNCGFTSTENIKEDFADPFTFLMDMSMLGVGVGGDMLGAGKVKILTPRIKDETFVVEDSREGWVELVGTVLNSFVHKGYMPANIDYTKVRPRGAPLKGFGGTASGPGPLMDLIDSIKKVLTPPEGVESYWITSRHISDIINMIGRCVVAGGIRRSSTILFGDPADEEFQNLKDPTERDALRRELTLLRETEASKVPSVRSLRDSIETLAAQERNAWFLPLQEEVQKCMEGGNHTKATELLKKKQPEETVRLRELRAELKRLVKEESDKSTSVQELEGRLYSLPLEAWRWSSNNSLVATVGMDYTKAAESIAKNGEPGLFWLDNARAFSRMGRKPDWKDKRAKGCNPCFAGDTLIAVADGRGAVPIKDLAETGNDVPVYAMNPETGEVAVQRAWRPRKTRSGAELLEIQFEGGGSLRVTPDHGMLTMDGRKIPASEIRQGFMVPYSQEDLRVEHPFETFECDSVVKPCEVCGRALEVPFGRREESCCSPECFDKLAAREQQGKVWGEGVEARRVSAVVKVRELEDVYNLTVKDFHTVGIALDNNVSCCSIVFTENCSEQTLNSMELCTLVETFPANHDSFDDFAKTLKFAYLYAKTVTLVMTHNQKTNNVMAHNRRIGCSMSGIVQAVHKHGRSEFRNWCKEGYKELLRWDETYSEWLGIPKSIKITSVKPSGTVSLLCNATPGIHFPHSQFYIRNIRVQNTSPLVQLYRDAGYPVEKDRGAPDTSVISFPVEEPNFWKSKSDVSMWEQLALVEDLQWYWADNQVSCLTGSTLVRTSQGWLRMSELSNSMFGEDRPVGAYPYSGPLQALNADNEWSPISALVVNEPKPLVRVVCEGGQILTGTPEHQLRVIGPDLEFQWKPLSEIGVNDYLVEVINHKGYNSTNQIVQRRLEKFQFSGRSDADRNFKAPTCMTRELGELLGFIVSDGHIHLSTDQGFGLTQRSSATAVVDRFHEIVPELFGSKVCTIVNARFNKEDPVLSLAVNSKKGALWLRWLGVYDEKKLKRVPWPVMMAGEGVIKAFLRGVTLDGHFSNTNGRIYVMTTNSYKLAEELCVLLKHVGFQPALLPAQGTDHTMKSPYNGKVYNCDPTWTVSLSTAQSARFMRMIGFAEDHKNEAYAERGDKHRHNLFGGVPDFGLRDRMRTLEHRCQSRFLNDHWHGASCHPDKEVSRETLLQMRDMGESIPEKLLQDDFVFRRVLAVEPAEPEVTYDLTVTNGHSYIANGFASHNCTVTFKPEEAKDIKSALETYETRLKSVSFLPLRDHGYDQAPYIEIDEATYRQMVAAISPVDLSVLGHDQEDKGCDGEACLIKAQAMAAEQSA